MPADDIVGDWQEPLVRAVAALDPGLFAQARDPLVGTRGRVARFTGPSIVEATRVDVVAPAKERAKQPDLGIG